MRIARHAVLAILGSLAFLPGCGTLHFYSQGIAGHWEIMRKARPNAEVLADPSSSPQLRERLTLAEELRNFAQRDLDLPASEAYGRYTALERKYAVFVVYAAPEFSLQPKAWWYPVVGRQDYRGYFSRQDAEQLAERLRAEGWDVHLGGVRAYSTLGWFHDPLLDTFLFDPELELAEGLFHELSHHKLYVRNHTDYNEALATMVGREGVRRWLKSRGEEARLRRYEETLRKRARIQTIVAKHRKRLGDLYASSLPVPMLRDRKADILQDLRSELTSLQDAWSVSLADWLSDDLNNAHLVSNATYYRLIPFFEQLLRESQGDLRAFFDVAKERAP